MEELKLELGDCDEHIRLGQKGIFPGELKGTETKPVKPKPNTSCEDNPFDAPCILASF